MGGFQLWANLPASHKMMDPRYRGLTRNEIPEISVGKGVAIKVICGKVENTRGPVTDIVTDPEYLDVTIPAHSEFVHPTKAGSHRFRLCHRRRGYLLSGEGPLHVRNGRSELFRYGKESHDR